MRAKIIGASIVAVLLLYISFDSATVTLPRIIPPTYLIDYKHTFLTIEADGYGGDAIAGLTAAQKVLEKLNTTCIVNSFAASANALICVASNKIVLKPGAILLFHLVSSEGQVQKNSPVNIKALKLIKRYDLLTEKQKEELLDGKDVFFVNVLDKDFILTR